MTHSELTLTKNCHVVSLSCSNAQLLADDAGRIYFTKARPPKTTDSRIIPVSNDARTACSKFRQNMLEAAKGKGTGTKHPKVAQKVPANSECCDFGYSFGGGQIVST